MTCSATSRHAVTSSRFRATICSLMGGGQAVMRDGTAGVNYGASDPRKDGAAVPEPVTKNE